MVFILKLQTHTENPITKLLNWKKFEINPTLGLTEEKLLRFVQN